MDDYNKFKMEIVERISNSDCTIILDDTHRWVDTDGFYGLSINIIREGYELYLEIVHGGGLEEEYSENNPQRVYVGDVTSYMAFGDSWLVDKINDFLASKYDELDCNTGNGLQYQDFL